MAETEVTPEEQRERAAKLVEWLKEAGEVGEVDAVMLIDGLASLGWVLADGPEIASAAYRQLIEESATGM